MKQRILDWMRQQGIGDWSTGQLTTVHEESDQVMTYMPLRPWRMSALHTTIEGDEIREHAVLNQPLRAAQPWRSSALLRCNEMIPECWTEDGTNCAVRQISTHLKLDKELLEEFFTEIRPDWRAKGLLADDLLKLGARLDCSVSILGENRLLKRFLGKTRRRSICCHLALGHFSSISVRALR